MEIQSIVSRFVDDIALISSGIIRKYEKDDAQFKHRIKLKELLIGDNEMRSNIDIKIEIRKFS